MRQTKRFSPIGFEVDFTHILFIYLHGKILHFHWLLLKKMQRGRSPDSTIDVDFSVHLIKQILHYVRLV